MTYKMFCIGEQKCGVKKPLPLLLTSDSEDEFVGVIFVHVKVVSPKL